MPLPVSQHARPVSAFIATPGVITAHWPGNVPSAWLTCAPVSSVVCRNTSADAAACEMPHDSAIFFARIGGPPSGFFVAALGPHAASAATRASVIGFMAGRLL